MTNSSLARVPVYFNSTPVRSLLSQLLYDTFSAFGVIVNTPKIMRDPDTGNSRGFGFVSYDCFEASDAAIDAMNGQYLCNRAITVSYAFKKDTKGGARCGVGRGWNGVSGAAGMEGLITLGRLPHASSTVNRMCMQRRVVFRLR